VEVLLRLVLPFGMIMRLLLGIRCNAQSIAMAKSFNVNDILLLLVIDRQAGGIPESSPPGETLEKGGRDRAKIYHDVKVDISVLRTSFCMPSSPPEMSWLRRGYMNVCTTQDV
jgi:hypothetical protein